MPHRSSTNPVTTTIHNEAGPPPPPRGERRTTAERWRPILISLSSSLLVFGLLVLAVTRSEQWPRVRKQFFSWDAMKEAWPDVAQGFLINLRVWVIAMTITLIFGLILALARSFQGPIAAPFRILAATYIDVMRGIPVLLLLLLLGFGVPALRLPGLPTSATFWGTVAMVSTYSAYTAEVYRSGIDAVHSGQNAAARALGLNQWQTMRYTIVPQAIRNVTPAMLNLAIAMQKDVSLLSVLGVREAVREAQLYSARTFNYSALIVAAGLFLVASVPLSRFTDWYTERDRNRRLQRAFT